MALIASISSCCRPGRSSVDRDGGLSAHLHGITQSQHDLIGTFGGRDRISETVAGRAGIIRPVVDRQLVVAQGAALGDTMLVGL